MAQQLLINMFSSKKEQSQAQKLFLRTIKGCGKLIIDFKFFFYSKDYRIFIFRICATFYLNKKTKKQHFLASHKTILSRGFSSLISRTYIKYPLVTHNPNMLKKAQGNWSGKYKCLSRREKANSLKNELTRPLIKNN